MTGLLLFMLALQAAPAASDRAALDPRELQAVIETSEGAIILEFYPDQAPRHVEHFIRLAREGFYDGTAFHSTVPHGIVQGGDPSTKDPARRAEYGAGGFNLGLDPEFSAIEFASGTVAATLLPGEADSAGAQFFICIGDQPQFTGQFTAFAHVVEGLEVADRISQSPTDENQIALDPVEVLGVTIRPIPPPAAPPFSTESIEELSEYQVVLETSHGDIRIDLLPEIAPNHVRHFLRLSSLGVYDQTAFHRVAPGFVIQAGDLNTRTEPYPPSAARYVTPILAEPGDVPHTAGIVSMARDEDPASALTSFFIVLSDQPDLDGFYTVFGRVAEGMDVVERIAAVETENERPRERVDVYAMRVERRN